MPYCIWDIAILTMKLGTHAIRFYTTTEMMLCLEFDMVVQSNNSIHK